MVYRHSEGYLVASVPSHPHAQSLGRYFVHRLVMEKKLGRLLRRDELVHHKDGNKQNNSLSNLELVTASEHKRLHAGWKKIEGNWWKTCRRCLRFLEVNSSNFYPRKKEGKDTFTDKCKPCEIAIVSEWTRSKHNAT